MFTRDSVTVVTAATGHPNLLKCLQSVQRQTYGPMEHVIVADGRERSDGVQNVINQLGPRVRAIQLITLPHATGKDKWCGHRIYAAMCFLVNTEFITFLDEDNWLEPDHVGSLMQAIKKSASSWAFCLRNICDSSGRFIARDECESLGNLHPIFNDPQGHLIDTNCYFLHREVAVRVAHLWYAPGRPPDQDQEPDRLCCKTLFRDFPRNCSSRKHTLNYTVANRPDSVKGEFFLYGNQLMHERYPGGLPWEQAP